MINATNQNKIWNLLFVVCHPDDEAIWIGGLISELSGFDFLKIHVICLSGGEEKSPRLPEFLKAKEVSGYDKAYISKEPLHKAENPLPSIKETVSDGLKSFNLGLDDIDILITHSPYGDEHGHPHHKQAYGELYKWTREKKISFGYFSTAVIPFFDLRPILQNMGRIGTLQMLQLAQCKNNISLVRRFFSKSLKDFHTPKYYLQFLTSPEKKKRMIECYNSIDLESHKRGYVSYSQNSESLYIVDKAGMLPFQKLIDSMEIPGRKSLFPI